MDIVSVFEGDPPRQKPDSFPTYRVIFFERLLPGAYSATTYCFDLTEAHNVFQVFAWAEASARGRTFSIYATKTLADGTLLMLQLSGDEPNQPDDPRRTPPPELAAPPEVETAGDDYEARMTQLAMDFATALHYWRQNGQPDREILRPN